MFAHSLIRPLIFAVGSLVAGLLLLGAVALLINLSWFDATLHPELQTLKEVEPLQLEENAYSIALGFVAADGLDPRAAGEKILQALHERFLRGDVVSSSRWRNPYTGDPMEVDPESHTIGFVCLHTAFHPPASPDKCSIAIEAR